MEWIFKDFQSLKMQIEHSLSSLLIFYRIPYRFKDQKWIKTELQCKLIQGNCKFSYAGSKIDFPLFKGEMASFLRISGFWGYTFCLCTFLLLQGFQNISGNCFLKSWEFHSYCSLYNDNYRMEDDFRMVPKHHWSLLIMSNI